jgi:hypothetical protein
MFDLRVLQGNGMARGPLRGIGNLITKFPLQSGIKENNQWSYCNQPITKNDTNSRSSSSTRFAGEVSGRINRLLSIPAICQCCAPAFMDVEMPKLKKSMAAVFPI